MIGRAVLRTNGAVRYQIPGMQRQKSEVRRLKWKEEVEGGRQKWGPEDAGRRTQDPGRSYRPRKLVSHVKFTFRRKVGTMVLVSGKLS